MGKQQNFRLTKSLFKKLYGITPHRSYLGLKRVWVAGEFKAASLKVLAQLIDLEREKLQKQEEEAKAHSEKPQNLTTGT